MEIPLRDYLESVERMLRNRTGIDCLSERPAQDQLANYDLSAVVSPDALSYALARALTCLQATLKVSIRCPLPASHELTPENVAKMLTRMASFRYRPDPPRSTEWTSDGSLEQNLRLVYREHLQGILEKHRLAPHLSSSVHAILGSVEQLRMVGAQLRFCHQIMRPGVLMLVADAMKSLPAERRARFLQLVFELLAELDPTAEQAPEFYQRLLAQCRSLMNPSSGQKSAN